MMNARDVIDMLQAGNNVINELHITINENTADLIVTGGTVSIGKSQPTPLPALPAMKSSYSDDPWAWRYDDMERRASEWQRTRPDLQPSNYSVGD